MAGRSPIQLEVPNRPPTFDIGALDELVQNHGVPFMHWRALRCPAGLDAADDTRRPHEHPDGTRCQKGYIYVFAGKISATFLSSGVNHRQDEAGYLSDSTALVTFERFYSQDSQRCGGCVGPARIAPRDRLYLDSDQVTVDAQDMFDASPTGVDRLSYPVVEVLDLYDSQLRCYRQNEHFRVDEHGRIAWVVRPPVPTDGRLVCSARYTYRPYWYVERLHHESRVCQAEVRRVTETGVSVGRQAVRLNIHASIVREYEFEGATAPAQRGVGAGPPEAQPQFGPR